MSTLKHLVRIGFTLLALPLALLYWLATRVLCRASCFAGMSQLVSLLPGKCGVYFRQALYRQLLPRCGENAQIGFLTLLTAPSTVVGNNVYVGPGCVLGDVSLEEDVLVASHVSIINGVRQHGIERLDIPISEQPGDFPRISIGQGSWIGERAIVMADVGRHCVVGAGAVVTHPVPDFAIAVGVPARILRYRQHSPAVSSERPRLTSAAH